MREHINKSQTAHHFSFFILYFLFLILIFFMSSLEIRWHSRAGHGAITAANAFCEIAAENTSLFAQSFPDFGAEKKGAPVLVYNRFSSNAILGAHLVEFPDVALLLDTSLINENELSYEDVLKGLKSDGTVVINTKQEKTKFNDLFPGKIVHIDATTIAEEEIGRNIPNVPMLGALVAISGIMSHDDFLPHLQTYLSSELPAPVVEGNLKAFSRGFKSVNI